MAFNKEKLHIGKENVQALVQAAKLVWNCAPGWAVLNLILQIIQGFLPLVNLYLIKLIIDAVSQKTASADFFYSIGVLVAATAGVTLLIRLCSSLATLVQEQLSWVVSDYVNSILHSQSISLDLAYYENPAYYDTLHMAQQEAPYRPNQVVSTLANLVQNGIQMAAMVALLTRFHWSAILFLLPVALPGILVKIKYSRRLFGLRRRQSTLERESSYYDWMLISQYFAKEVRLFNLGPLFIERYRALRKKRRAERLALTKQQVGRDFAAEFISTLVVFSGLAIVAFRAAAGAITLGDLVMYYQAFQRSLSSLKAWLSDLASIYENSLFLSHFFAFLRLKPGVVAPVQPKSVPRPLMRGLRVEGVSFSYPQSERQALTDINLEIQAGEHIAIVGENGSGKTTLIKLLCRLYDPDSGRITMDGIPLTEFSPQELRWSFSVLMQDYVNYFMTARENIWLGNVELSLQDERIVKAAIESGADEVINRLPKGYETHLGKWFEEGEELSVGEWQKLAISRALIRDAGIVILDEPTSALDAAAEYKIFELFRKLAADKTAIFISHRLASARISDRIVTMQNGRIIEQGSHEELMRRGGVYARLFELQSRQYMGNVTRDTSFHSGNC